MIDTNGHLLAAVMAGTFCILAKFARQYWKFFVSLFFTLKAPPYAVHITLFELIFYYPWFFLKARLVERRVIQQKAESMLLDTLRMDLGNVLVTHSCRTIFYCVIQALLDEAQAKTGTRKVKICVASVQFSSFYQLLQSLQKSGNVIDLYEVDLKDCDWTLDEASILESEVEKCDLILCQHFFGIPFRQDGFFELAKKHNIPVLEDLVQSGSLFGEYQGRRSSDIVIWSCGLDKTPSCFGGGLGHFRNSKHGRRLFAKCQELHGSFAIDSTRARLVGVLTQIIWIAIARNAFFVTHALGVLSYLVYSKRSDYIQWHTIALNIRKNQSISPFAHETSKFCRQPSTPHLLAICYGLSTRSKYVRIAQHEIRMRDILLQNVPVEYHDRLFPWLTKTVLNGHRANGGISEFTWVASEAGTRLELLQFLNDRFIIAMINTTWTFHKTTKLELGKRIVENLIHLPNINEMNERQVKAVAAALTAWCRHRYEAYPRCTHNKL